MMMGDDGEVMIIVNGDINYDGRLLCDCDLESRNEWA